MQRPTRYSKILRILTTLSLGLYVSLGSLTVALADDASPSPTPTPVVSASPDPTPLPSASPSPSPSADPSPDPTPQATPTATPSPTPTPSVVPNPHPSTDAAGDVTGPSGCTGTVPAWVFDTVSRHWQQADQASFICDQATGYYLSPKYFYNKTTGWYVILAPDAPVPANLVTAPNLIHTVLGDITVGSKDYQIAKALGLLTTGADGIVVSPGASSTTTSGNGSSSQTNVSNTGQTWLDLTNLVSVINTLDSAAKSGDVGATGNTNVGALSSGTANVIGNLINLLAAAWSWSNGNLSYFMQNFFGNQNGNILLNPTQTTTGSGGQLGATSTSSDTLNVNAQSSGSIVNNVNLVAQSGDTTANANTTAGNVTSGAATAQVNILNLISSLINSGNSFFGILNIFGSLTGNILLPHGFFDGLIPSGANGASGTGATTTGPNSTGSTTVNNTDTANINNSATSSVANNITTNAKSGNVSAGDNTTLGSAASGAATTTQGLFNLANTSLFGDNAVLVIVNVLGHWVGKIMTLPGGSSTSALLTSNATTAPNTSTTTGPGSTTTSTTNNTNTANVNQAADGTITNNVTVGAQSGDVSATGNTTVGNVTSGKASAVSSVANVVNSVLNVKHWFGVLVINVFGDWLGNVDTAPASTPAPKVASVGSNSAPSAAPVNGSKRSAVSSITSGTSGSGEVAGTSTTQPVVALASAHTPDKVLATTKGNGINLLLALSAFVMLLAGALFSAERKLTGASRR